ncbi:sensor histidine kinase [Bacillus sp. T33-2]|uniref:sensor histidine kinase n=1 Tax=Bacillus sp. T33-2 TaxID=2054168 RepID=UPI0015E102CA|nr:HAMP domain-containing sensor histidine kinase [Bacillus sp. T33-2]
MKRRCKMGSKGIFSTLVKEYIYFSLMVGFIVVMTSIFYQNLADRNTKTIFSELMTPVISDNMDYKKIKIDSIEEIDGWVEILDRDKQVVFVKGKKRDGIQKYTDTELFGHTDPMDEKNQYYYSVTPFFYGNKQLYCVVKIPNDRISFLPSVINPPLKFWKVVFYIVLQAAVLFFILYGVNIYFYSRRNAKKIGRPLTLITEGLLKMNKGRLDTRLDFTAEYEYEKIRNAFNYMAAALEKTEREKEQVEESKKRMLVDISHDLKTPMTTIQGYSKALYEGLIDDEKQVKKYLKFIHDKSIRVSTLIDDLFTLSKLDNPEFPMVQEECDIGEFVREIIAEHYEQFEEKEMRLSIDIPKRKIIYKVDKKLLYRAITNILGNAVKYNPKHTNVYIKVRKLPDSIQIEILDNGIGIPGEIATNLFEPFFRGDKSRNEDGGSGLGLAITKRIVELHKGTLALDTNPERGKTKFVLTFPL